jgi:hypothetical protein
MGPKMDEMVPHGWGRNSKFISSSSKSIFLSQHLKKKVLSQLWKHLSPLSLGIFGFF